MPNFISVLASEVGNATHWVHAQEAGTLNALERLQTYDGISRIRKSAETYTAVSGNIRSISNNATSGEIDVISYRRVAGALSEVIVLSSRRVTKKKSTKKKPTRKRIHKKPRKKTPPNKKRGGSGKRRPK